MSFFPVRRSHNLRTPFTAPWNPFTDLTTFQDRIAQMFGSLANGDLLSPENIWSPSLDITENDKEMIIKVDVAGMEKKDVNVEIDQGDIVIKGERKIEKDEKKANFVHVERSYGSFFRRLPMPDYVDKESIKATCKNGLLELKLKIVPGAKKEVKAVEID